MILNAHLRLTDDILYKLMEQILWIVIAKVVTLTFFLLEFFKQICYSFILNELNII